MFSPLRSPVMFMIMLISYLLNAYRLFLGEMATIHSSITLKEMQFLELAMRKIKREQICPICFCLEVY